MSKYIKKFQNSDENYDYINNSNNFLLPNVSRCVDEHNTHFNRVFTIDISNDNWHADVTEFLFQGGHALDVRYYDDSIIKNNGLILLQDNEYQLNELINAGLKLGSTIILENCNFFGGEHGVWETPIKCTVNSINVPDYEIYVNWADTMSRYQYIDTDLDIDGHYWDQTILDNITLTGSNYQDIPKGSLVAVRVDHNGSRAMGEVWKNTGDQLVINVYYFLDDENIIYPQI